jgi:hypothetical protein
VSVTFTSGNNYKYVKIYTCYVEPMRTDPFSVTIKLAESYWKLTGNVSKMYYWVISQLTPFAEDFVPFLRVRGITVTELDPIIIGISK